ncbi:hypothetical protein QVD17_38347 [Tagetes erecta]|uniref:Magnesium transporter MgtE intracellular domain-containing protein n=1 Tax=Tagetes erecta TaxID=13708 RepID=A0AAD8JNP7_TARER|nr:hypothetical protein QVD17_38347 [Tagetes erecta]
MANSGDGDKFGPLIIPNCRRTTSQEEKLQACPFARQSKPSSDNIQSSSSADESPEQATGIEILTLPESSDEYHTPPEHHSCSQNSSNEGQIPPTMITDFDRNVEDPIPVDDAGEHVGRGFVEKSGDVVEDNNTCTSAHQVFDEMPQTSAHQVFDEMPRTSAHQVFDEMPQTSAHQVFDEMPQTSAHQVFDEMPQTSARQVFDEIPRREQENVSREKRKLPFSMKTQKKKSNCSKHEAFMNSMNRVLKMVGERKTQKDNDGDEMSIDLLESAKMRGLSFPRPRWWPADGLNPME